MKKYTEPYKDNWADGFFSLLVDVSFIFAYFVFGMQVIEFQSICEGIIFQPTA